VFLSSFFEEAEDMIGQILGIMLDTYGIESGQGSQHPGFINVEVVAEQPTGSSVAIEMHL
jgi:hypothetical protein